MREKLAMVRTRAKKMVAPLGALTYLNGPAMSAQDLLSAP
jgi:hypothetical protein